MFSMKNSGHKLKTKEKILDLVRKRGKMWYIISKVTEFQKLNIFFKVHKVKMFKYPKLTILSVCSNLTAPNYVQCWPKLVFLYMCTGKGNEGREHTIVTK